MFSVKRTVAYMRNSADIYQDNSIQLQKDQAYICATKNSLTIDEIYNDSDTSARKKSIENREALSRLLSDIKVGLIGSLIVYKRDRLARRTEEYMEIYEVFKQHQVTVYFSASNEFPMLFTPQAFTIEYLLASFAEHEDIQLKQRLADTNASKFSEGTLIPSVLPFGYKRHESDISKPDKFGKVKKTVTIKLNPPAVKVVEQIYNELLTNSFKTMKQFKNHLAKLNLTRSKKGKPMGPEDIKQLIRQPLYKGLHQRQYQFHERPSTRYSPDLIIISEENWNVAQSALEQLIPDKPVPNEIKLLKKDFFLSNILKCDQCLNDSDESPLLEPNIQKCCYVCKKHKISVDKQQIEQLIVDHCIKFFTELIKGKPYLKNIQKLHVKLRKVYSAGLNERFNNLTNNFSNLTKQFINAQDPSVKSDLLLQCNEARGALIRIKEKLNASNAKLEIEGNLLHSMEENKDLLHTFTELVPEAKSRFIEDIIDTIVVDCDEKPVVILKIPNLLSEKYIGGIFDDLRSSGEITE
ncbi:recombinase family protein [Paenibacillus odorifer]|uniref:recombinase family protein n=1 Tax=Paenibacillus odorifer TaxID=189426 RepID=UPI00096DE0D1|nr:recombinase family protein [Paenibacillus odorifer]OME52819.1 hypothetical protein BSK61_18115 [Paenibacillus odorifer]